MVSWCPIWFGLAESLRLVSHLVWYSSTHLIVSNLVWHSTTQYSPRGVLFGLVAYTRLVDGKKPARHSRGPGRLPRVITALQLMLWHCNKLGKI